MNAYELADITDRWAEKESAEYLTDAAIMLRQQADRIAELEKEKQERALQRLSDFTQEASAEPVAWIAYDEFGDFMLEATKEGDYPWIPLYTTPQTKPLSDEEMDRVINGTAWIGTEEEIRLKIARAIEERILGK